MRVIEAGEFGGPEVLQIRDAPDPVPAAGEVVVRVAAVDTLWVETVVRGGQGPGFLSTPPPYVPGGGVAGTVTAVGAGVESVAAGDRVAARTEGGGYAEQVAVPASAVVPVPDGVDLTDAAALTRDGVTARAIMEDAATRPGERLLVVGATGGMGVLLVQLGRAAGAHVIAAARGEHKLAVAAEAGAHETVDYSEPGWAKGIRADVVLDGVGGAIGAEAFTAVADGGRFSAHGAPAGGFAEVDTAEAERRGITVRGITDVQLDPDKRKRLLAAALRDAASGTLRPVIGQTYPLERAADAHAAIEDRTVVAKTLLLP